MEQGKARGAPRKARGNQLLRRGRIRNHIIGEFFKSLAAPVRLGWSITMELFKSLAELIRLRWKNGGGGPATTPPASGGAYNSEGTSDA